MSQKKLLLTRPEEEALKDKKLLENLGFEVFVLPTIAFKPLPFKVPNLEDFSYIYFGSKRAVNFFLKKVKKLPDHIKVIAVGEKTADSLRIFGVEPYLVLNGSSDHLLEMAEKGKLPKGKILVPTAENYLKKIHRLEKLGFSLRVLKVYRTVFVSYPFETVKERLRNTQFVIFTSPSTFKGLLHNLQNRKDLLEIKKIIAIGKTTAKAVEKEGLKVWWVPSRPDMEVLARELLEVINGNKE